MIAAMIALMYNFSRIRKLEQKLNLIYPADNSTQSRAIEYLFYASEVNKMNIEHTAAELLRVKRRFVTRRKRVHKDEYTL